MDAIDPRQAREFRSPHGSSLGGSRQTAPIGPNAATNAGLDSRAYANLLVASGARWPKREPCELRSLSQD